MSVNLKEYEKILKALANKRRLEILKYLKSEKKASVGDIAEKINLSFKSTSRHLSVLLSIDLVENEQKGLSVFYSLTSRFHSIAKTIINDL